MYFNVCNKHRRLKKLKYHTFLKKTSSLSILYIKCAHEYEKIFKEKESIEILQILGLINNTRISENTRVSENI